MNHLLVARHDGVDRRILARPQTCETKLGGVIGERCGNVRSRARVSTGDGEEHRRNLTDHGASLPQMGRAVASGEKTKSGSLTAVRQKQATGFGMTSLRKGLYGSGGGGKGICWRGRVCEELWRVTRRRKADPSPPFAKNRRPGSG
jgi:hypothetical protein